MKYDKRTFAMSGTGKLESMASYVRSSEKADECNCGIVKSKSKSGDYPAIIECTVILSHKKIAAGDEIVLYREKAARVVALPKVIVSLDNTVEPAAKKAKKS